MNKYQREIKPGIWVDVYDILKAWDVRNPALQHLIKKALQAGNRGHKDIETDLQDIIDSAVRAKELELTEDSGASLLKRSMVNRDTASILDEVIREYTNKNDLGIHNI